MREDEEGGHPDESHSDDSKDDDGGRTQKCLIYGSAAIGASLICIGLIGASVSPAAPSQQYLASILPPNVLLWTRMPDIPNQLGFAGALSGTCGDRLLFAGGSNFPAPIWTSAKHYDDGIWSLAESSDSSWAWTKHQLVVPHPVAYAACGTFDRTLICAGGQSSEAVVADTLSIKCTSSHVEIGQYPELPIATAFASSAIVGSELWVIGGQTGVDLTSATRDVWILDTYARQWRKGPHLPSSRILSVSIFHNGHVYVMSGRRQEEKRQPEFLSDCWKLNVSHASSLNAWTRCADVPACVMGGTIGVLGHKHILVLGGDDGAHFGQVGPDNPGYPSNAYMYDDTSDSWIFVGKTPEGEVTTLAIPWKDGLIINGGEVKPRVRTNHTWFVKLSGDELA